MEIDNFRPEKLNHPPGHNRIANIIAEVAFSPPACHKDLKRLRDNNIFGAFSFEPGATVNKLTYGICRNGTGP